MRGKLPAKISMIVIEFPDLIRINRFDLAESCHSKAEPEDLDDGDDAEADAQAKGSADVGKEVGPGLPGLTRDLKQGCQILLDTTYQNGQKCTKTGYTKWP
jgi:hypothetical protein